MFAEFFLLLSGATGIEVVPLQNLTCGLLSAIASPLLLAAGRRALAACHRPPVPFSPLAASILDRMADHTQFTRHDEYAEVQDGTLFVRAERYRTACCEPCEPAIEIDNEDVTGHLSRAEAKAIYARAVDMAKTIEDDEIEAARVAALSAITPDDNRKEEEDSDTLIEPTLAGCQCEACERLRAAPSGPTLMKR